MLQNNTWTGGVITAPADNWVKMLDFQKTRKMLKIHHHSENEKLRVAFSEDEAHSGLYIRVQSLGFIDQVSFCPTNEIWVYAENEDIRVCYWLDSRDYQDSE